MSAVCCCDKILQSSQPLRHPRPAVEQARGFAKRLVIEAHRLTAQRRQRTDRCVELFSSIVVAKELKAGNGGDAEAECAGCAPRRGPLPWRWNARISICRIEAAHHLEDACNVGAGLTKN
jgi:hypothetical protein